MILLLFFIHIFHFINYNPEIYYYILIYGHCCTWDLGTFLTVDFINHMR